MGPIFGSLGDRVGKKWFLVGGALLGVVGSVISGSAHKITDVIGGNILTGVANAGCVCHISNSTISRELADVPPDRLDILHPRNYAQ
jgi:MFS family permease